MILSTLTRIISIRANENNFDIDSDSKINNKIVNLSSFIKEIIFKVGFFTLKASLVFTWLKKVFIKALILLYFHLEYYIEIKIDTSGYAMNRVIIQLNTKKNLAD